MHTVFELKTDVYFVFVSIETVWVRKILSSFKSYFMVNRLLRLRSGTNSLQEHQMFLRNCEFSKLVFFIATNEHVQLVQQKLFLFWWITVNTV